MGGLDLRWKGDTHDANLRGGHRGGGAGRLCGRPAPGTVGEDLVGGTCLNRGCIPTKALYSATEPLGRTEAFRRMGIEISAQVDLERLRAWTSEVVATLRQGVEKLLAASGVEIIKGEESSRGRRAFPARGGCT